MFDPPVYLEIVYENGGGYTPAVGAYVYGLFWDLQPNEPNGSEDATVPANGVVSFTCPEPIYQELRVTTSAPITSYTGSRTLAYNVVHSDASATEGTWYDPNDDEIVMKSDSYESQWSAAHEYAHALHKESLGGTWSAENCLDHSEGEPSSYKCAFREGFGDYTAHVAVSQASWFENVHYYDQPPKDEANVAALFTDLIDSNHESGDLTTYGPYYVATVFKTCVINGSDARDDVSDFVWCLENRIDSTLHSNKFPGISVPSSVSENASEPGGWDADDIRSTWLKNVG